MASEPASPADPDPRLLDRTLRAASTHARAVHARNSANALTHGLGAAAALAGGAVLITLAALAGDGWQLAGAIVFGVCLLLLYLASTLYHAVQHPVRQGTAEGLRPLRDLPADRRHLHAVHSDRPARAVGLGLFAAIWTLALAGVVFKLFFTGRFKRPVDRHLRRHGLAGARGDQAVAGRAGCMDARVAAGRRGLLHAGHGRSITARRCRYSHAIWHLFVVAGSVCHYVSVLAQVMKAA